VPAAAEFVACASAFAEGAATNRNKLRVTKLDYPFGSNLIHNGLALLPDGSDLPGELRAARGLPFGIITHNSCEVAEAVLASEKELYAPQAVLQPGHFIGVFELLDEILAAPGPRQPDWTISAGARSLYFTQDPTRRTAYQSIRKYHAQQEPPAIIPVWDETEFGRYDAFDLIKKVAPVWKRSQEWKASVLYFSTSWIDELKRRLGARSVDSAAMGFLRTLMAEAWRGEARVRDGSSILYDLLVAWGGKHRTHIYEAALQLLQKSRQALEGRRPCFVPAERSDTMGPWDTILDGLLAPAKFNRHIMLPKYLEPGQVGFLPLAHIVPAAFEYNALDNLKEVLGLVRTAQDVAVRRRGRMIPALETGDLFPHLALRVKTGGGEERAQAFALPEGRERELQPIGLDEYFAGAFPHKDRRPGPGSEFFRVTVRIERPL
jgi:hypothetical protein